MDVRDHTVALPEVRLHVREWAGDGPPIVLLHGLASNAHIWDAVAPILARQGRVVAPDQRGHGLSDKPDDGYDFARVVADARALVAVLDLERPTLVGHSWGGNVALQYAASVPAEDVAGLVLVDGGFIELGERWATWEQVEQELAPPDLTSLTMEELLRRVRGGDAGAYWSDAVEATIRGSFAVGPDGKVRPRLSRPNHLKILRALWEQRPSELYDQVRCPVLIVPARRPDPGGHAADETGHDVEARGAPRAPHRWERQVARASAAMPRARILWMEDTVHDVPLQRPGELAAAIASLPGSQASAL